MSALQEHVAVALTKNEARCYLRDGTLPEGFADRVKLDLQFLGCVNCDGRKCMGCVFRDWDHECEDDCPDCCGEPVHEVESQP